MFVYRLVDWLRNSTQYVFGAALYFAFSGNLDLGLFALGLAGFVISYNSIYFMNDLLDYESDRKDKIKKKTKPMPAGRLTKRDAVAYYFASLFIGLPLSFAVSRLFGLLVASLLLLNLLHSTVMKRIGMKAVTTNMFAIQFIKYSLGWFAFTAALDTFPLFVFSSFSAAYITFYLAYKMRLVFYGEACESLKESAKIAVNTVFKKNRLFLVPASLTVASYVLSIILYPFKFQLLLLIPLIIIVSAAVGKIRFADNISKVMSSEYITVFSMLGFITVFLLMQNPVGAEINESMNESVSSVQKNLAESVPQELKERIYVASQAIDSDRERLESLLFNLSR